MSTPVPPPVPNEPEPGTQPPAPQYGQNAPQFGQPTPPAYGQQPYGQSPYAQYPSEKPQANGPGGVPQLVNVSFWLLIGAAAVFVISTLMGISMLDDPQTRRAFEDAMRSGGANGAEFNFNDFKSFLAGMLVVMAILGAGLYLLVAFFIRKGKNWARVLGTVFAALSVFGLFQVPTIGTLGTLAGIAAIVLLYLPATAPYFRKQQPFANPYTTPGNPYGQ
ncbi:MAG: hypothetical protein NVS1B16_09930 [Pseudarthrobacter sp.]